MNSFDKTATLVRDTVVSRYSEDFADTLYVEARQEFEALIPQMPYIDNRAAMLRTFLFITTQELAVYKAMKRHGKTTGEAWEICHDALRSRLEKVPGFVRWLAKQIYWDWTCRPCSSLLFRKNNLMTQKTLKSVVASLGTGLI